MKVRLVLTVLMLFLFIKPVYAAQSAAERSQGTTASQSNGNTYKDPKTGMEFVFVKGGCYDMGDTFGDGRSDEKPVHQVCVNDFYIGKYEVTQAQWRNVRGNNPSRFSNCGETCPVESVSWGDVQEFIRILNQRTGKTYRLPTEAEWEYAARSGGKKEKWADTSNESDLSEYAWYNANSSGRTHPVGQKRPNSLGIYDMTGNVWEWVEDWYDSRYYSISPKNNPHGSWNGQFCSLRGGSWLDLPGPIRASARYKLTPDFGFNYTGFRLLLPVR